MDPAKYYKDGSARILELMRATFGDDMRGYFDGEAEPSEIFLPCIMVTAQSAGISSGGTGTDNIEESILIIISANKKDDLGADPNTNLTEFKLRKWVYGQDPNTEEYLPKSIMYALRRNISMDDAILRTNIKVDFAANVRGGTTPISTMEAYISVNLTRLAMVPSRV